MRSMTTVSAMRVSGKILAVVGMALGLAGADTACLVDNTEHCMFRGGDAFCQSEFGEQAQFCSDSSCGDQVGRGCTSELPLQCWYCQGEKGGKCDPNEVMESEDAMEESGTEDPTPEPEPETPESEKDESEDDGIPSPAETESESESGDGDGEESGSESGSESGAGFECESFADCSEFTPACVDNVCVACGDAPESCAEIGAENGKTECHPELGSCVECLKDQHCGEPDRPICDEDWQCRGCESHSECGDGACDGESGQCVDEPVYWVDGDGLFSEGLGTKANPFLKISDAIEAIGSDNSGVVHVIARTGIGAYAPSDGGIISGDRTVYLIGHPRFAGGDFPTIQTIQSSQAWLQITGGLRLVLSKIKGEGLSGRLISCEDNSKIVIEDSSVRGTSTVAGAGPEFLLTGSECELRAENTSFLRMRTIVSGGGSVSLNRSLISETQRNAIDGTDMQLRVEASTLIGNRASVLSMQNGRVDIVNSMLVNNESALELGGSEAHLVYSTLVHGVDDEDGDGPRLIDCDPQSQLNIRNSIVLGRGAILSTACPSDVTHSVSDVETWGGWDSNLFFDTDDGEEDNFESYFRWAPYDYHLSQKGASEWSAVAKWEDGDPVVDFDGDERSLDELSFPGADHHGG